MRKKIHWRQLHAHGNYHGFRKIPDNQWRSLCGRVVLTKLGKGPSLKDINGWLLCAQCDGLEQGTESEDET
jgi:hypothetical protein